MEYPPFGIKAHVKFLEEKNKELQSEVEHLKVTQNCPAPLPRTSDCWCMGNDPGMPLCRCDMVDSRQVNGRWINYKDVGPVKNTEYLEEGFGELPPVVKD